MKLRGLTKLIAEVMLALGVVAPALSVSVRVPCVRAAGRNGDLHVTKNLRSEQWRARRLLHDDILEHPRNQSRLEGLLRPGEGYPSGFARQ